MRKQPDKNPSLWMIQRYFPTVGMVKDADKPAIVTVTDSDNNNSVVKSHRTCAFALASKRCFHADGVIIGLTTSWIIKGRVAYRYHNTGTISREITSFDRKAGFDAGNYLLTPVNPAARLGTVHSHNPNRSGMKSSSKRFRHFTRNVRASLHNAKAWGHK